LEANDRLRADNRRGLQDCEFHQVACPFLSGHLNLKAEFSRAMGRKKKLGIAEAVNLLGMGFEGSHHRGLDVDCDLFALWSREQKRWEALRTMR
jgi:inhibitor of KinA sporulation pathway (predicted exonuclease)